MSLNEIIALVRRAALGCGLPYGLAEDAGAAAGWLVEAGLDDGRAIADALDGVRDGCAGCACWERDANTQVAVACLGPSIVDRLACPGFEAMRLLVDVPLVLVGMVGARRGELAGPLQIRFDAGPAGQVSVRFERLAIMVIAPSLAALVAARRTTLRLTAGRGDPDDGSGVAFRARDLAANRQRTIETGAVLAPEPAGRLRMHAVRSLVPTSDLSRRTGAGAGSVDQD